MSDHNAKGHSVGMGNQRRFFKQRKLSGDCKRKDNEFYSHGKNTALVNKYLNIVHYCHLIVFVLNNKNSGLVGICHEDMTGKRGENVMGLSVFPISVEF